MCTSSFREEKRTCNDYSEIKLYGETGWVLWTTKFPDTLNTLSSLAVMIHSFFSAFTMELTSLWTNFRVKLFFIFCFISLKQYLYFSDTQISMSIKNRKIPKVFTFFFSSCIFNAIGHV